MSRTSKSAHGDLPPPITQFADPNEPEDIPTTKSELFAWWLLSFANEPISTVVLSHFLPLLLESLPRAIGHMPGNPQLGCSDTGSCIVFTVFGIEVSTSSFSLYVTGLSRVLTILILLLAGPIADYCCWRKRLLIIFTIVGSLAGISFLFVFTPKLFWLAAILAILLRTMQRAQILMKTGYLPTLVLHHPDYVESNENLYSSIATKSSIYGYAGGSIMVSIAVIINYFLRDWFFRAQFIIALCGIWWFALSVWSFYHLLSRRGPPLPKNQIMTLSIKKLLHTFCQVRSLPYPFIFTATSILYTAAYLTADVSLTIVSKSEAHITEFSRTITLILRPISSIIGNLFFLRLQNYLKLSTISNLALMLTLFGLGPLVSIIGLFSVSFGMRGPWEYHLVIIWYNFLIGPIMSADTVLLAELSPSSDVSEFYAIHSISSRVGGFLGLVLVGYISDLTKNFRYGQIAVALLSILPVPILLFGINIKRARLHLKTHQKFTTCL